MDPSVALGSNVKKIYIINNLSNLKKYFMILCFEVQEDLVRCSCHPCTFSTF